MKQLAESLLALSADVRRLLLRRLEERQDTLRASLHALPGTILDPWMREKERTRLASRLRKVERQVRFLTEPEFRFGG